MNTLVRIREHGNTDIKKSLIAQKTIKSLQELMDFVELFNVSREYKLLKSDLEWSNVTYFITLKETI